jgi:hypothetical protein
LRLWGSSTKNSNSASFPSTSPFSPPPRCLSDFDAAKALLSGQSLESERNADWAVACLLGHYERLVGVRCEGGEGGSMFGIGGSSSSTADAEARCQSDPLRPEVRRAGRALGKAFQCFNAHEQRVRRDVEQRRLLLRCSKSADASYSADDGLPTADESSAAASDDADEVPQPTQEGSRPSLPKQWKTQPACDTAVPPTDERPGITMDGQGHDTGVLTASGGRSDAAGDASSVAVVRAVGSREVKAQRM